MINKLKILIIFTVSSFLFTFGLTPAYAATLDCASPQTTQEQLQCGACNGSGVNEADCSSASKKSTDSINTTITTVINLVSLAAGIIAVIMLVLGAVRYITSSGNEQSVAAAKKTIIYALIGLVIVALAQVIVRFTLSKATQTSSGKGSGSTSTTQTTPPGATGHN